MRKYITPGIIENEKRALEQKQSKEIIQSISDNKDIEKNIDTFIKGYNHELDTYFKIIGEVEQEKENLQRKKRDDIITDTMLDSGLEEQEAKANLLEERTINNLKELSDKLKDVYNNKSNLSGDNLDDEVIKLLQSGIKLTNQEFREITKKYFRNNNQTMIRVLGAYADDNGLILPENESPTLAIDDLMNFTSIGLENKEGYSYNSITSKHRDYLIDNFKRNLMYE